MMEERLAADGVVNGWASIFPLRYGPFSQTMSNSPLPSRIPPQQALQGFEERRENWSVQQVTSSTRGRQVHFLQPGH